jgi:hypothetical protein
MPKNNEPLQKHTLFLFEGDYQRIQELYPEVGGAVIIRQIIRNHLNKVVPQTDLSEVEVETEI